MSNVYYNEFDPKTAAWLRQLGADGRVSAGTVDERSITDVRGDDLCGFRRVHLFAGIGGWDSALKLAGWPDDEPVWTGSCPCQPFSSAGKRKGQADERHLWHEMFRLIRECRPPVVFGEQVEGAVRHGWLDGVFADLEAEGYACGAVVLGAHSVGAPHIRQRLFWVADARRPGDEFSVRSADAHRPAESSAREAQQRERRGAHAGGGSGAGGLVLAGEPGLQGHAGHGDRGDEPGRIGPLAHGSTAEAGGAGGVDDAASSRRFAARGGAETNIEGR